MLRDSLQLQPATLPNPINADETVERPLNHDALVGMGIFDPPPGLQAAVNAMNDAKVIQEPQASNPNGQPNNDTKIVQRLQTLHYAETTQQLLASNANETVRKKLKDEDSQRELDTLQHHDIRRYQQENISDKFGQILDQSCDSPGIKQLKNDMELLITKSVLEATQGSKKLLASINTKLLLLLVPPNGRSRRHVGNVIFSRRNRAFGPSGQKPTVTQLLVENEHLTSLIADMYRIFAALAESEDWNILIPKMVQELQVMMITNPPSPKLQQRKEIIGLLQVLKQCQEAWVRKSIDISQQTMKQGKHSSATIKERVNGLASETASTSTAAAAQPDTQDEEVMVYQKALEQENIRLHYSIVQHSTNAAATRHSLKAVEQERDRMQLERDNWRTATSELKEELERYIASFQLPSQQTKASSSTEEDSALNLEKLKEALTATQMERDTARLECKEARSSSSQIQKELDQAREKLKTAQAATIEAQNDLLKISRDQANVEELRDIALKAEESCKIQVGEEKRKCATTVSKLEGEMDGLKVLHTKEIDQLNTAHETVLSAKEEEIRVLRQSTIDESKSGTKGYDAELVRLREEKTQLAYDLNEERASARKVKTSANLYKNQYDGLKKRHEEALETLRNEGAKSNTKEVENQNLKRQIQEFKKQANDVSIGASCSPDMARKEVVKSVKEFKELQNDLQKSQFSCHELSKKYEKLSADIQNVRCDRDDFKSRCAVLEQELDDERCANIMGYSGSFEVHHLDTELLQLRKELKDTQLSRDFMQSKCADLEQQLANGHSKKHIIYVDDEENCVEHISVQQMQDELNSAAMLNEYFETENTSLRAKINEITKQLQEQPEVSSGATIERIAYNNEETDNHMFTVPPPTQKLSLNSPKPEKVEQKQGAKEVPTPSFKFNASAFAFRPSTFQPASSSEIQPVTTIPSSHPTVPSPRLSQKDEKASISRRNLKTFNSESNISKTSATPSPPKPSSSSTITPSPSSSHSSTSAKSVTGRFSASGLQTPPSSLPPSSPLTKSGLHLPSSSPPPFSLLLGVTTAPIEGQESVNQGNVPCAAKKIDRQFGQGMGGSKYASTTLTSTSKSKKTPKVALGPESTPGSKSTSRTGSSSAPKALIVSQTEKKLNKPEYATEEVAQVSPPASQPTPAPTQCDQSTAAPKKGGLKGSRYAK